MRGSGVHRRAHRQLRPKALLGPVRRFQAKVTEGNHGTRPPLQLHLWAAREARAGYYRGRAPRSRHRRRVQAVTGNGRAAPARPSEYAGILAWAVGQANAADLDEVRRIAEQNDARPFTPAPPSPGSPRSSASSAEWLDLPDPAHVLLTLAAAVTRDLDGEPVWLLLVAVPSSGKTETVRLLDKRADGRLNEVTAAGLLGWTKGKESKPSGVSGPHRRPRPGHLR